MKKQILLSIALTFILAFGVKADPVGIVTVTIDDVVRQPGTVLVPVYADFSNAPGDGVGAFDLTFKVENDNVLTDFNGVDNPHPEIDAGDLLAPSQGTTSNFSLNWKVGSATPTYMVGKLFDLEFDYAGGDSEISFFGENVFGESEIGETDAEPITATFVHGSITQAPPIPIALWSLLIGFGLISLFTLKRSARNR